MFVFILKMMKLSLERFSNSLGIPQPVRGRTKKWSEHCLIPPKPILQHDVHPARERGHRGKREAHQLQLRLQLPQSLSSLPLPGDPHWRRLCTEAGLSLCPSHVSLADDLTSHSLGFLIYKRGLVRNPLPSGHAGCVRSWA